MGGSSKKQTVGYRYALGAHLALCHGPVDAIREIRVDDRTAWSIATGAARSGEGTGAGAETLLGTVAGMSAATASEGDLARVSFAGSLAGIRLGQAYDLALADGSTRTVTVRSVAYDGDNGITTWLVEPASLAFAAQSVTVKEAGTATSMGSTSTGGGAAGGRIRIDKPDLFGGTKREGGIVGDVDVMMGAPDQGQNDYLAARAGADVPGYRGLCSLVLRQVYLGLNPYLKPWAVRLTRVLKAQDGAGQWYAARAPIVPEARIGNAALYIAMDASGSMSGTRMAAQIAAVSTLVGEIGANAGEPNDVEIVTYNAGVIASITRRDADVVAYTELKAWVDALSSTTSGGTDYGAAVSRAGAFFSGAGEKLRILIFVTDGEPSPASSLETAKTTLAGIANLDVFAFNIALSDTSATAQLDNTPVDGVPVVPPGDDQALVASLRAAFGQGPDMNPAHIIRECLTNSDWGLGHGETDIGPSFTSAADTLFAEGFGLSLLWQRESTIEDFIAEVLMQGRFSFRRHRPVRCDNLDEHNEWVGRAQIGENDVGQIPVGLDFQANAPGQLVVPCDDFIGAFAHKDDGGLFQELARKVLDDGLGNHRARARSEMARCAAGKGHQHMICGRHGALSAERDTRERAGSKVLAFARPSARPASGLAARRVAGRSAAGRAGCR